MSTLAVPILSRRATKLFALLLYATAVLLSVQDVGALHLRSTESSKASSKERISRREIFSQAAAVTGLGVGGLLVPPHVAHAGGESGASKPIAILGASGRTGALCVTACLSRGLPVLALTRSGSWNPPGDDEASSSSILNNKLLTVAACDVKDTQALTNSLKGCQGVVYAASASKQGGNAVAIDNEGVVAAGNICLAENIARYVVISSTATTRPKSLGYIFTNVFGGIMEQKRLGEEGVQAVYEKTADGGPSYSIVRPGGLEEPKKNEILGPKVRLMPCAI